MTCSDRCRRLKDFTDRKVNRRLAAIDYWECQAGRYPREFLRAQVRALKAQIRDLRRPAKTGVPAF